MTTCYTLPDLSYAYDALEPHISPKGGGEPDGALSAGIRRDFGTFDSFKKQLTKTASTSRSST